MQRLCVFIVALILCKFAASCNQTAGGKEQQSDSTIKSAAFKIISVPFGHIDSNAITRFDLTNQRGMLVSILNYGGTITQWLTPDRYGKYADVVLGFDSLSGYLQKNNPYMGALVGRYGNRIANAKFVLDGKTYTLAANN